MALSPDELQAIVDAVLSTIRTNALTIEKLSAVTVLSDDDSLEVSGGKRINYQSLRNIITVLIDSKLQSISSSVQNHTLTINLLNRWKEDISQWKAVSDTQQFVKRFDGVSGQEDSVSVAYTSAVVGNKAEDTRGFNIAGATQEKAGVMTAAHVKALDDATEGIKAHNDEVGISGFDAIVDKHPNVLEDFNVTAGSNPHIIFDRSRVKFLLEVHDGEYVCPAGDALENWSELGEKFAEIPRFNEFYDVDGKVRTDRIYRCGADLYRFEGDKLVAFGVSIEKFNAMEKDLSNIKKLLRYDAEKGTSVLDNAVFVSEDND